MYSILLDQIQVGGMSFRQLLDHDIFDEEGVEEVVVEQALQAQDETNVLISGPVQHLTPKGETSDEMEVMMFHPICNTSHQKGKQVMMFHPKCFMMKFHLHLCMKMTWIY